MKNKKSIIVFLTGVITGAVLILILLYFDTTESFEGPKYFGDIRINAMEEKSGISEDSYQWLILERNEKILILVYQTLAGMTKTIVLYDGENNRPVVTLDVNSQDGKMGPLKYGKMSPSFEPIEGHLYMDIDVDGEVDLLCFQNTKGKVEKFMALVDEEWKLVTFLDFKKNLIKVEGDEEKIPMATSKRD